MHAPPLKRFVSWLIGMPHLEAASTSRTHSASSASVLEFDPFWHGDHWQNLLASPMDARHYVMEDWAVSTNDRELADSSAADKLLPRRRMRG